jgi:predicted alpha/beta-fold hydrolase
MDLLKSRYPNAVFGAIGFSMGSMMLTRTIHRRGAGYVSCAVSVSNPFDLLKASHNLLRFPYRHIHTRVLAGGLRKLIQDNQEIFRGVDKIDFEAALSCKSVREFDEFVTRRLFGYESVDQYYIDASPCRFVHEIQTPLLCINATDDPVAPPDGLPRDTIRTAAGDIALLETNRGSHISFLHCESKLGTGLQSIGLAHRWATTFVLKYLLPNTKNTSVETKTSVDEPQHQQVSEADVSKA